MANTIKMSDEQVRRLATNALGMQQSREMRNHPLAAKPAPGKSFDSFQSLRKVDLPEGAPAWGGRAFVDGDQIYACNMGMFNEDEMCFSIPVPQMQLE